MALYKSAYYYFIVIIIIIIIIIIKRHWLAITNNIVSKQSVQKY